MKKIIISMAAFLFTLQSCDVLDVEPLQKYSESTAYSSIKNLDLYVKSFYGIFYANSDINVSSNCLMDDGATDLIKYSWYNVAGGMMNKFFYENSYVTPDGNFRSNWSDSYTRIRQFNEYFADLNVGYGNHLDAGQLAIRTAEVRFMRAFAYQELVLRHGGVILRIGEDHVEGPEENAKMRSSEADCWEFIISEYDKAAHDLPKIWVDDYNGNNVGRITTGAAYGMKARAALYAKRWQDAINACDEVTKLANEGFYTLLPGATSADYLKIFTANNNKELILPVLYRKETRQHAYDLYFAPPYDYMAAGIATPIGAAAAPTDEYASSFDINIGGIWQDFDWDNLNTYTGGPWANRDPRFYSSILYNGATWKGRTLQLYDGGADGYMNFTTAASQDNLHKTTTGYLFRKFMKDDASINFTSVLSDQQWIEMRYAEIILIRSEAYARLNNFGKAYENLNIIRNRVNMPQLPQQNSWENYLKNLSKERVCELGLEGHRYFDLIRWGTAVKTLNGTRLHGVKITPSGAGFNYSRVECDTQDRYFPERYTIFPIPRTEIRNNKLCEQNELWK